MPQMAPLYWELLFFMFIMTMIIMSTIIYHIPKISKTPELITTQNINQINWKW
uniref:ATP synthase complex subunit 8 n=1 Tax=Odontotarsus purpureolineatus TaxID=1545339 RepID=A0A2P1CLT5_9HEMI|nr:ATP synthase F0 subunit 8 [Odontotarsus purpureolineatus]